MNSYETCYAQNILGSNMTFTSRTPVTSIEPDPVETFC